MSYIKSVVIREFSIFSRDGDQISLGGEITALISLDYGESIFEPVVKLVATFAGTEKALSLIKTRGTERATLKIEHPSGILTFDDLRIQGTQELNTTSTATVFAVNFMTPDAVYNEQRRLTQRYEPTVKISSHVESILTTNLRTDKKFDIEETANADGFFGNNWMPFKAIYWLAKRSISTTGSSDGAGTDRAGFLFWETKSGYNFKSIDTIASNAKSNVVQEFYQSEVVDETDTISNFYIFKPFFEKDQDIIGQMRMGMYSDRASYYNVHTLGTPVGQKLNWAEVAKRQTHFGESIDELEFGVNENGGFQSISFFVDGTMNADGKISYNNAGNGEYNPHQIVTQARMKYMSMQSISLRITVPFNLELEAGLPINVNLLSSNRGIDKDKSGVYLIKDLRHSYSSDSSYTNLRLIRDTYGISKDS